eukprot:PLAT5580.1.p1 GENE.PLAT5580.1~~PLAT5580.1.p1  ORF type:complete len:1274 (-),score=491.67 PLAT5580.1:62-3883(-)
MLCRQLPATGCLPVLAAAAMDAADAAAEHELPLAAPVEPSDEATVDALFALLRDDTASIPQTRPRPLLAALNREKRRQEAAAVHGGQKRRRPPLLSPLTSLRSQRRKKAELSDAAAAGGAADPTLSPVLSAVSPSSARPLSPSVTVSPSSSTAHLTSPTGPASPPLLGATLRSMSELPPDSPSLSAPTSPSFIPLPPRRTVSAEIEKEVKLESDVRSAERAAMSRAARRMSGFGPPMFDMQLPGILRAVGSSASLVASDDDSESGTESAVSDEALPVVPRWIDRAQRGSRDQPFNVVLFDEDSKSLERLTSCMTPPSAVGYNLLPASSVRDAKEVLDSHADCVDAVLARFCRPHYHAREIIAHTLVLSATPMLMLLVTPEEQVDLASQLDALLAGPVSDVVLMPVKPGLGERLCASIQRHAVAGYTFRDLLMAADISSRKSTLSDAVRETRENFAWREERRGMSASEKRRKRALKKQQSRMDSLPSFHETSRKATQLVHTLSESARSYGSSSRSMRRMSADELRLLVPKAMADAGLAAVSEGSPMAIEFPPTPSPLPPSSERASPVRPAMRRSASASALTLSSSKAGSGRGSGSGGGGSRVRISIPPEQAKKSDGSRSGPPTSRRSSLASQVSLPPSVTTSARDDDMEHMRHLYSERIRGAHQLYMRDDVLSENCMPLQLSLRESDVLRSHPQLARGELLMKQGQFALAATAYTAYIRRNRKSLLGYFLRGIALEELGNHDKAALDFSVALLIAHGRPESLFNRAVCRCSLALYGEAVKDLTAALALTRDEALRTRLLNFRARCYRRTGDFEPAMRDYATAAPPVPVSEAGVSRPQPTKAKVADDRLFRGPKPFVGGKYIDPLYTAESIQRALETPPRMRLEPALRRLASLALHVPYFNRFPDDVRKQLSEVMRYEVAAPETMIVKQGTPGDAMYIILTGKVAIRVSVQVVEMVGEDVIVNELAAGDSFGETSLLDHSDRKASVVAQNWVELLVVDKPAFDRLVRPLEAAKLEMKRDALSRSGLFRYCDRKDMLRMAETSQVKSVDSDAVLVRQGQRPEMLYLLLSGVVRVFRHRDEDGNLSRRVRELLAEDAALQRKYKYPGVPALEAVLQRKRAELRAQLGRARASLRRSLHGARDRRHVPLAQLSAPAIFGEAAVLKPWGGHEPATVVADTNVDVIIMSKHQLHEMGLLDKLKPVVRLKALHYPSDSRVQRRLREDSEWADFKRQLMDDIHKGKWPVRDGVLRSLPGGGSRIKMGKDVVTKHRTGDRLWL